jgi:hypothetical protein
MTVRILYENPAALLPRHHGVSRAVLIRDDERYEPGALVPDLQRRLVSSAALERLRATAATPDSALIELVRPPTRLADFALEHVTDRTPSQGYVDLPVDIPEVGGRAYDVTLWTIDAYPGDVLTTTINGNDPARRRAGLHPDNWDKLPIATRLARSRRRLVINLGPGRRYLLIVFPDILAMSEALYPGDEKHVPRNDARQYAHRFPDEVKVHWIAFDAGEAYIAPAELIAHDGSTYGINAESSIASYLGRWPRRFFPSLLALRTPAVRSRPILTMSDAPYAARRRRTCQCTSHASKEGRTHDR